MRFLVALMALLMACEGPGSDGDIQNVAAVSERELIVLAAPLADDPYYAEVADAIFEFQVAFARKIETHDDVLVLTDRQSFARYAAALGDRQVAIAPMADIWPRDFGLANTLGPVMFRYTAAGQGGGSKGQRDADAVQARFARFAQTVGLTYAKIDLLNDGGNFVHDDAGRVVVSRKFLRDNRLTEEQGRAALWRLPGVSKIAFIDSDEQGGLEHADGVVAFVDTNTLIINTYSDDPAYAFKLRRDLEKGLPGVAIHEIVTPYSEAQVHDARFGSACGLYTNALVTPHRVYLPQFGIPEDEIALRQVRAAMTREVVPIMSQMVCHMGGGVRCMSLQLRDANAESALRWHRASGPQAAGPK